MIGTVLLPAAIHAGPVAAQAVTVHTPDGRRPPILEALTLPDRLQALALSPDGRRAALAVTRDAGKGTRTRLDLHSTEEPSPVSLALPGLVRDLLFSPDGSVVFVLHHETAKRRAGEVHLAQVELRDPKKLHKEMLLPPSAHGLGFWSAESSLLVACRDEIRTIRLPGLRSGPLYRIPGGNLSVASIAGSRVLVGQAASLVIVDLADPPGREQMPLRASVASPAPVVDLAVAGSGSRALARGEDGRVFRVGLDPLRLEESARGLVADRAWRPAPAGPPAETVSSADPSSGFEARRAVPPPVPAPGSTAARAVEPETPPSPEPTPSGDRRDGSSPPVAASLRRAPAPPVPPESRGTRVGGMLAGPAVDRVVAVVLFGPDNILREAARAVPSAVGRWEVHGLEPGRYRVQLDGGGSRVLVTEPRFRMITIDPPQSLPSVDFRVLREQ